MDDMFRESLGHWEGRIKTAEKERDWAVVEAGRKVKSAEMEAAR